MRLESIQVGKPRNIDAPPEGDAASRLFRSESWFSGYGKARVDGPVRLTRLNLEGDGQADKRHHGGPDMAVLAYSAEHYPLWRSELTALTSARALPELPTALPELLASPELPAVLPELVVSPQLLAALPQLPPLSQLPYGAFAENLTVSGADEATVCLGDVWELGSVLLQIAQPRKPCINISKFWHCADLLQRVVQSGRFGWYLRVLREGVIEAGAEVRLISRPHPDWTVERAMEVRLGVKQRAAEAAELSALPELGDDWRTRITQALAG